MKARQVLWAVLIAAIGSVFAVFLMAAANKADGTVPRRNIYGNAAIVVELDRENDIVVFEDFNGFRWEIREVDDWRIGDCASLVMDNNNTPLVYDDIVITAQYEAWEFSK